MPIYPYIGKLAGVARVPLEAVAADDGMHVIGLSGPGLGRVEDLVVEDGFLYWGAADGVFRVPTGQWDVSQLHTIAVAADVTGIVKDGDDLFWVETSTMSCRSTIEATAQSVRPRMATAVRCPPWRRYEGGITW